MMDTSGYFFTSFRTTPSFSSGDNAQVAYTRYPSGARTSHAPDRSAHCLKTRFRILAGDQAARCCSDASTCRSDEQGTSSKIRSRQRVSNRDHRLPSYPVIRTRAVISGGKYRSTTVARRARRSREYSFAVSSPSASREPARTSVFPPGAAQRSRTFLPPGGSARAAATLPVSR